MDSQVCVFSVAATAGEVNACSRGIGEAVEDGEAAGWRGRLL